VQEYADLCCATISVNSVDFFLIQRELSAYSKSNAKSKKNMFEVIGNKAKTGKNYLLYV
jgi:hypothetical protein